jgi:hypothetical protein
MKTVLRVYYISHRLKQKHYEDTQCFQDFPNDVSPEATYAELLTKRGSIMDGKREVEILQGLRIKVAPDEYITINSHAMVDQDRKPIVLESERFIEQALFGPMELRACLQDSPDLKARNYAKNNRKNRS